MRNSLLVLLICLAAATGCKHHARKVACNDCLSLGEPIPSGGARITPTEVPLAPRASPSFAPPSTYVPDTRSFSPGPSYVPPPTRVPAATPQDPPPREILLPPELPASQSKSPPATAPKPTSRTAQSAPPVGLPNAVPVAGVPGVTSGQKATPEGFKTLKTQGVKTILYLHPPGTDTTAAGELAAAQDIALISLAVSPENLADTFGQFTKLLGVTANRPLYVMDDSRVRAGSLWYLYFRKSQYASDEAARVRAAPLGLPADAATDEAKTFWLAVQKVMAG